MTPKPRMPRQVRLPFGFVARVLYRTSAQLKAAGLADSHGCWLWDTRTIYINRDDHVSDQATALAHEMQHVMVDYLHWVEQCVANPLVAETVDTVLAEEEE